MIKLYGLTVSFPVNRVQICLNAMNLEYEFIQTSPLTGETQSEDFLKMSPAGKIPAIEVDGVLAFESNAIMKFLCRMYQSDYYPADINNQLLVDSWCDFSAIHVGNGIAKALFNKILAPALNKQVDTQSMQDGYAFIERFFAVIDRQLGQSTYIANDALSIADFSLLATIDPADVLEVDMNRYPHLLAWRNRLMQENFYTQMHHSFGEALEVMMQSMQK